MNTNTIRMMDMYDRSRNRFYWQLLAFNLVWFVLLVGGSVTIIYFVPLSDFVKIILFISIGLVTLIAFGSAQFCCYRCIERKAQTRRRAANKRNSFLASCQVTPRGNSVIYSRISSPAAVVSPK